MKSNPIIIFLIIKYRKEEIDIDEINPISILENSLVEKKLNSGVTIMNNMKQKKITLGK